jgi:hypothetical protein
MGSPVESARKYYLIVGLTGGLAAKLVGGWDFLSMSRVGQVENLRASSCIVERDIGYINRNKVQSADNTCSCMVSSAEAHLTFRNVVLSEFSHVSFTSKKGLTGGTSQAKFLKEI